MRRGAIAEKNGLATAVATPYHGAMSSSSKVRPSAPQNWTDALDRARADVAAGRTVPASAVMAELRETIIAMQLAADSPEDEPAAGR